MLQLQNVRFANVEKSKKKIPLFFPSSLKDDSRLHICSKFVIFICNMFVTFCNKFVISCNKFVTFDAWDIAKKIEKRLIKVCKVVKFFVDLL